MFRLNAEKIKKGDVLFAPEGFVDQRYLPALKRNRLPVLELRVLADGPVFQRIEALSGNG